MKSILKFTITLVLLFMADYSYPAVIKMPVEGTVVNAGEKFKVIVEVDNDEPIDSVGLFASHAKNSMSESGNRGVNFRNAPYEHKFIADIDYIGEATVSAIVVYKDKNKMPEMLENKISIGLPRNVKLLKIGVVDDISATVWNNEFIFNDIKDQIQPTFKGLFSDGLQRELPVNKFNIIMMSDNQEIIDIHQRNKLVAKKEGRTNIRAFTGDIQATFDAKVDIKIYPPRDLKAKVVNNSVTLEWKPSISDPKYVTSYKILRRQKYAVYSLAEIPSGSITYTDNTAIPGEAYTYIVRAVSCLINKQSFDHNEYVSIGKEF